MHEDRAASAAVELATWWAVGFALWLVTLSSMDVQDIEVGAGTAAVVAVLARRTRRAAGGAWRLPRGAVAALALLPLAVAGDTARLLALRRRPVGPGGGRGQQRVLATATGDSPAAAGERAAATWLLDGSPGTVVIDVHPGRGELLVHFLASGAPGLEGLLTRGGPPGEAG